TANSCAVAGDIKQRSDTDIITGALDYHVSAASVGQVFNLLLYVACSRIYCIVCAIFHSVFSSGFDRVNHDYRSAGSCTYHGCRTADGAAADDYAYVRSVRITSVAPYSPVTYVEVLNEDTNFIGPVFRNDMGISFFQNHVFAESSR